MVSYPLFSCSCHVQTLEGLLHSEAKREEGNHQLPTLSTIQLPFKKKMQHAGMLLAYANLKVTGTLPFTAFLASFTAEQTALPLLKTKILN